MFEVYCLTGPTGKRYIGISRRLKGRLKNHRLIAKTGAKAWHPLYRAIAKYGFDAFSMVVLARCDTAEAAKAEEVHQIASLGTVTPGGYNVSRGGNYDGEAGGSAVVAKLRDDPGYRAKRRAIAQRSAPLMTLKDRARCLRERIAIYKPCPLRDGLQAKLRAMEAQIKKSNSEFRKSPTALGSTHVTESA